MVNKSSYFLLHAHLTPQDSRHYADTDLVTQCNFHLDKYDKQRSPEEHRNQLHR